MKLFGPRKKDPLNTEAQPAQGRPPEVGVWVKRITFSDGSAVDFDFGDVVLIVGPNNSGKSATLRAIHNKLGDADALSAVVSGIQFAMRGALEQLISWLKETAREIYIYGSLHYSAFGATINKHAISSSWDRTDNSISLLQGFFCRMLKADERLKASDPPENIAIAREAPTHPIHALQRDDSLEQLLSQQFKKAFGEGIVVHRNAGKEVPILVGDPPRLNHGQDRLSYDYMVEMEKLPVLEGQGDGMRSFLGILLYLMVGSQSILLIDEPEVFLHPPQARHLGKVLVSQARPFRQLFLATHSGDILRGMLDSNSARVRVLRVRRSENKNIIRVLDNQDIARVWNDPLLRNSNVLDGLFHERVVLCESDADCRFYSAILDTIYESGEDDQRRPDIMFTHCGGKGRMPVVIRSLTQLGVPISVVVDFDVLNNEHPLDEIVTSAGGDWPLVQPDWQQVKNSIDGKKPELGTEEVKREIGQALSAANGTTFPEDTKKKIQAILRRSSPWSTAKEVGLPFVPNGQPAQTCDRLLKLLASWGIFIVPVGELEGFYKKAGRHGPSWVAEVLQQDLTNDPDFEPAKEFVERVISS